jgi:hypothetical protein
VDRTGHWEFGGGAGRKAARRWPAVLASLCLLALTGLAGSAASAQAALIHSFDSYVGGGTLSTPEGLTLDQTTGDLYVVEHGTGCVARYHGNRGGAEALQPHVFPATGTNKVCGFHFRFANYDGYPVANSQVGVDNSGTTTEGSFYINSPGLEPSEPAATYGFDIDGNLQTEIKAMTTEEERSYAYPCGVAVDAAGNVYVNERYAGIRKYAHNDPVTEADYTETVEGTGTACSFMFDSKGALRAFQLAGTIDRPTDDRYFTRSPYSGEGPFIRGTAKDGTPFEEVGPSEITDTHGVAFDETNGTLYVSDTPNGRVAVYNGSPAYRVDLDLSGTGLGAISASEGPLQDCGDEGTCSGFYLPSSFVLEATPQPHSEVDGWSGCDAVNPAGDQCTVEITNLDRKVTTTFTRVKQQVTASTAGSGSGFISSADPLGAIQNCGDGGTCSGPYDEGSAVDLIATPTGHSTFTGWSGACSNQTGPCEVVVEGAPTVTAHFTAQHPVSVKKAGTGAGSVVSEPNGLDCGGVCVGYFTDGQMVTLSAVSSGNSTFVGWSGEGCSGTGTCTLEAGGSTKNVTAAFAHEAPTALTGSGATFVGQHVATVSGAVNPNGAQVTSCLVEYGTSAAYGSQSPCAPSAVGAGNAPVPVGVNLTGLAAGTVYHYRLTATSIGGPSSGADQTFRTLDDTCDSNAALCPVAVLTHPVEPRTCRKGFVLKRGNCVKKKKAHRRKGRRHHRGGGRG